MENIHRTQILERATPPSTFNTYLTFVDQFIANKQYKRAIKMCHKALKIAPDSQKAKELLELATHLQAAKERTGA